MSNQLRLPLLARIQQRLDRPPTEAPEDSIAFRILVQALVTVGIIATDVAAADAVQAIGVSFWAVPLSFVGAAWSWSRRRQRNIAVKFCIAIAMLLALAIFLMRIVAERNDTRIALAELLIQLQVFHSFDLPRRKDLGYSMIIGLILLGVAATLSQTLVFAPLLLLFLAIALPVLILDYRSRLGLASGSWQQVRVNLSLRRLAAVLLMTIALGLVIFASLPRLPGYQVRTFPISATIPFQGRFNGRTVITPGEGQQGQTTGGTSGTATTGPGEVDDRNYYGFNTQINQNLRGNLTPAVVMRVRSQSPGFWRVLAFDRYTGQGWEVSRNDDSDLKTLDRSSWSFRFSLPVEVTLSRTQEVIQTYTIVADMPNLIPVLFAAEELYFPTEQVAIDSEGGLRSPVVLAEGVTYTVVSQVPYRDRTQLRQATRNYAPYIRDAYLNVPAEIRNRVRQRTEEILARSPSPLTNDYERVLYLAQYLKQNYQLLPELPFFGADEDMVEAFLFRYEGGYPDHFSTVLTVMLRSIGIASRLVAGFAPGEFNPFTGYYVVRNTDAFAMTEVYFPKYGWFAFNPIPGQEVLPPSVEEVETFGVLRQVWNWVAGWLPSPIAGWLNGLFGAIARSIGSVLGWIAARFGQGWVGLLLNLVGLIVVAFLGWLGWSGWRQWRDRRWLARLPMAESIYVQMVRRLTAQGWPKHNAQTPIEYAQSIQPHHPPQKADAIAVITQAYVDWRYGKQPPNPDALLQALQQLRRRSV
ncbi:DUF3488 domain-containing protein [Microcoleus sp. FACHB-1515]|uniref:transglutaminase TgpA family protein n=1 Tax=Cyanophyceae TaxID=3028117 RepID=UPI00168767F8|nr:DUF3488 and DUF4129 domain-containing transglutaminase family protein [Microcoleus sp. FACHB-1515]MBD2090748.1 DUF3488 domain-containing protein [Microcoleus sp. FACHB-1515]